MAHASQQSVSRDRSQLRSVASSLLRVGIVTVLFCLSAGISIPVGPVPFTLQTLVLGIAVSTLKPSEAISATVAYVAIGAMGAPVFSGYVGGLVRLLGPSGGFIYGFAAGAAAGSFLRALLERTPLPKVVSTFAGVVAAIAVSYYFGWAQLVVMGGLTPAVAFAIGCAPFILADLVKAALATSIAVPLVRAANK